MTKVQIRCASAQAYQRFCCSQPTQYNPSHSNFIYKYSRLRLSRLSESNLVRNLKTGFLATKLIPMVDTEYIEDQLLSYLLEGLWAKACRAEL